MSWVARGRRLVQCRVDKISSPTVLFLSQPQVYSFYTPTNKCRVYLVGIPCLFAFFVGDPLTLPRAVTTPPSPQMQLTDAKGGAAVAGIRPKDVLLSINGNSLAGDTT